MDMVYLSGI